MKTASKQLDISRLRVQEYGRTPFDLSSIASVPFQLLPHVIHPAGQLESTLTWQAEFLRDLGSTPKFSLLVLTKDNSRLEPLLESLAVQSCENYEIINVTKSSSTAAALKEAFDRSTGDYISCLTDETLLDPQALYILTKRILETKPALLYGNEVILSDDLRRATKFIRNALPDKYSMLSRNTFGEFVVLSRDFFAELVEEKGLEGVAVEVLAWRLGAKAVARNKKIEFIPLGLSAFRERREEVLSLAMREQVIVQYAKELGLELERLEFVGEGQQTLPRLFPKGMLASVQVIIPFKNQAELTLRSARSVLRQEGIGEVSVTLVNNGSNAAERARVAEFLESAEVSASVRLIDDERYFNFSRLNNTAALSGESEYILFLNNDVELREKDGLSELMRWAALEDVGAVGGVLYYPQGDIQSAGINFINLRPKNVVSDEEYAGHLREVDAVSLGMALVKRIAFEAVGGLDEFHCPNGFGDALFGENLRKNGFRVLVTPFARAWHYESRSRGRTVEVLELLEMERAGVRISDLSGDFHSERKPQVISLDTLEGSPVRYLAARLLSRPWINKLANSGARLILAVYKLRFSIFSKRGKQ